MKITVFACRLAYFTTKITVIYLVIIFNALISKGVLISSVVLCLCIYVDRPMQSVIIKWAILCCWSKAVRRAYSLQSAWILGTMHYIASPLDRTWACDKTEYPWEIIALLNFWYISLLVWHKICIGGPISMGNCYWDPKVLIKTSSPKYCFWIFSINITNYRHLNLSRP